MGAGAAQHKVTWDYTEHASHYDKRADYSGDAIANLLKAIGCDASQPVADLGAGTGKLTKELLKHGLTVWSVEPNDECGPLESKIRRASRLPGQWG